MTKYMRLRNRYIWLVLILLIIGAVTFFLWLIIRAQKDNESTRYTLFSTIISEGYVGVSEGDPQIYKGQGPTIPTLVCYGNAEVCILDPVDNKIIIYGIDGREKREVDLERANDDLWIDRAISVNETNTKFVLRLLKEENSGAYRARYKYVGVNGDEILAHDITFNGKDEVVGFYDEPFVFESGLIISGEGAFEGAFKLNLHTYDLEYEPDCDLSMLNRKQYKPSVIETSFTSNLDTIYSSDGDEVIMLKYSSTSKRFYVQKYETELRGDDKGFTIIDLTEDE